MFRCFKPFLTLYSRYHVGDEVNPEHFESPQHFANMLEQGFIEQVYLSGEGDEDHAHEPVPEEKPADAPVPADQPEPVVPTVEQQAAIAATWAAQRAAAAAAPA